MKTHNQELINGLQMSINVVRDELETCTTMRNMTAQKHIHIRTALLQAAHDLEDLIESLEHDIEKLKAPAFKLVGE